MNVIVVKELLKMSNKVQVHRSTCSLPFNGPVTPAISSIIAIAWMIPEN